MDIFYHLGHDGFELYTCACWTLLTHMFEPEPVQVFSFKSFVYTLGVGGSGGVPVCCSMKLTAVVYYLFMNIHEVCY